MKEKKNRQKFKHNPPRPTHELTVQYSVKCVDLCKQHALTASTAAHACLPYPICARGQINQLAKKLVSLLAVCLERLVNARREIQNLLPP